MLFPHIAQMRWINQQRANSWPAKLLDPHHARRRSNSGALKMCIVSELSVAPGLSASVVYLARMSRHNLRGRPTSVWTNFS